MADQWRKAIVVGLLCLAGCEQRVAGTVDGPGALFAASAYGAESAAAGASFMPPEIAARKASLVDVRSVPLKADSSPVRVVLPETGDGIHWLEQGIPVGGTVRFQGYFPRRYPWVAQGVTVAPHRYQSSVWVAEGESTSGRTPRIRQAFEISHDGYYPVTYQVPGALSGGEGMLLRAHFYGWGGGANYCENFADNHGYISIRNCASEYPDNNMSRGLSMWTFFGGQFEGGRGSNENGERVAESLLSVAARHWTSIDHGAGFTLAGTSYGGSGSILLSMSIPHVQHLVSVVHSTIGQTLLLETSYPTSMPIQKAWRGIDVDGLDFRKVAPTGSLDHIFYRIHGGSRDDDRNKTDFFRVCNEHRIACLGTWHGGGHSPREAGVAVPMDLYPGDPNMQARIDRVLPVFTNSTGNTPLDAERGHYNLGLSWNAQAIEDTTERLSVPLKYRAFTGFSNDPAKPMADMPQSITASVTLRRSREFVLEPGAAYTWRFGEQAGQVRAHPAKPEVTIDGLGFASSESRYTDLVLSRQ